MRQAPFSYVYLKIQQTKRSCQLWKFWQRMFVSYALGVFCVCAGMPCKWLAADTIHLTCWLEGNSGFGHRLLLNSYRMFAWGIEHFAYDSNFGFA